MKKLLLSQLILRRAVGLKKVRNFYKNSHKKFEIENLDLLNYVNVKMLST